MSAASLVGELAKSITSDGLILSDDPRYEQARLVWNGIADRRPAAIVKARNSNDIRVTIEIAAAHGALLAVRCGGHSLPGLSTCDGGIVLDLSAMNSVTIDPATRTAVVGGGALLGDLDRAGAVHGLVVPAGVVSHTGAAGLTLGGGMGWLSRRFGLTIDSLNSIDLITADGSEVHASINSEPEMFWGLRGGGGNFGVVTRFTYRMHPLGPVFVGNWQYPVTHLAQLLAKFHGLSDIAPRELTTGLHIAGTDVSVTAFWSGESAKAEEMLAPFGKLASGAAGGQGEVSFIAHQSRSDEIVRWGRRYYSKGGFFGDFSEAIIAELTSAMANMPTPDF